MPGAISASRLLRRLEVGDAAEQGGRNAAGRIERHFGSSGHPPPDRDVVDGRFGGQIQPRDPEGVEPTLDQCEAALQVGVSACERYFQSFNFVLWAGKSASEALTTALFETHGEA